MRSYHVPPNMNEKEKIVGGVFDINQAAWLGAGGALGLGVFLILSQVVGYFAIIPALPIALLGAPFALYKPKGLTLYQYLKRKRKFKDKNKVLTLMRPRD